MKMDGIKSVVIVGSGAIEIGEAGECDYSTSQAIKALREEGIRTIVVNPNIATIHTDTRFADKIYSVPIKVEFLEDIIAKERPDGILLGFGGQTALNCGVELSEKGLLQKYNVTVLGTSIRSIELADNRELFKKTMLSHGIPVPKSKNASDLDAAIAAAREIGYPVIVRVAYTLGGQGSGVARKESELRDIVLREYRRSEEHTSELQSHLNLVCRLLLEKKKRVPKMRARPRSFTPPAWVSEEDAEERSTRIPSRPGNVYTRACMTNFCVD